MWARTNSRARRRSRSQACESRSLENASLACRAKIEGLAMDLWTRRRRSYSSARRKGRRCVTLRSCRSTSSRTRTTLVVVKVAGVLVVAGVLLVVTRIQKRGRPHRRGRSKVRPRPRGRRKTRPTPSAARAETRASRVDSTGRPTPAQTFRAVAAAGHGDHPVKVLIQGDDAVHERGGAQVQAQKALFGQARAPTSCAWSRPFSSWPKPSFSWQRPFSSWSRPWLFSWQGWLNALVRPRAT